MISLEGRRFWILGLMPLSRWDILRAKFTFVLWGSLLITVTLSVLTGQAFRLGIGLSMALAAGLTIGVCCIPLWAGRRAFERMEI